jgi:hypothetical protein
MIDKILVISVLIGIMLCIVAIFAIIIYDGTGWRVFKGAEKILFVGSAISMITLFAKLCFLVKELYF